LTGRLTFRRLTGVQHKRAGRISARGA
jgi:hypothetical protein